MDILNSGSLFRTIDSLNQAFLFGKKIPLRERTQIAHWLSSRQGLKGAYANMISPTDSDMKGIRLITGDKLESKASIAHILGEESLRALYLLGINDEKTKKAILNSSRGINKILTSCYKKKIYAEGTYCCGKCTAALWRNLSADGVKKNRQYFESGLKYLKSFRDGKGKWKRFPFFYTLLALSDINLPAAKAELEYASDICRRYVNRKSKRGLYENRKREIAKKVLDITG